MRIIPRAQWGARYASAYRNYDAPLPAAEVWLHHSATIAPDLVPPFDDDHAAIRTLERIGQDRFGWGISYTWLVTPAGLVFEGHRVNGVGTHTAGHNSTGRAICFVGNYEDNAPTSAQLRAAAWLLRHAHGRGWIRAPRLNGGHRDLKATACPGGHAYAAIPHINQLAAGGPIEEGDMPTVNEILMGLVTGKDPDTGAAETHPFAVWLTVLCYRARKTLQLAAEVAGRDPVDVDIDEAAVAAGLAPMLVEALAGQLSELGPDDLQRIATAVADEQARRLAA